MDNLGRDNLIGLELDSNHKKREKKKKLRNLVQICSFVLVPTRRESQRKRYRNLKLRQRPPW